MLTRTASRYLRPPTRTPGTAQAMDTMPLQQYQPATMQNPAPVAPTPIPGVQSINPQNSLRGTQIAPNVSDRLRTYQANADHAVSRLNELPDRQKLAEERFNTFAQQTEPAFQAAIRDATRAGSMRGQLGSGGLRTQYGNLAGERIRALTGERATLMQNALEGSIADRFNTANAMQGYARGIADDEAGDRAELRGERGYTDQLEEQAFNRRIQQYLLQQQAQAQQFNQGATLANIGYAGNPAEAYMQAGNQAGADASSLLGGVGSLMQNRARTAGRIPEVFIPQVDIDPYLSRYLR